MANWNLPTVTSGYLDFVTEMNNKFVDAGTIGFGAPTNLPEHSMRFNRTGNNFEEWEAGIWNWKILSIIGGGTGSNTPAGARINLGIGSMGTQNSNAVNITGGSITGVNFDAAGINTGVVALARGGTGSSLALAPAGHVLLSNGASVGWDSGVGIVNLNASAITQGTVPDARLSANIPKKDQQNIWVGENAYTGYVTFQAPPGANAPTLLSAAPLLNFYEIDQPADKHFVRICLDSQVMAIERVNDAYNAVEKWFQVTSAGIVAGNGMGEIYGNGVGIQNLNASQLTHGTVATARLGAGAAHAGTFLRGDSTWAAVATGGEVSPIPVGMIAIFATSCPAGWTRVSGLDGRFPRGAGNWGATGGGSSHNHGFSGNTNNAGSHAHGFSGSGSGSGRTGELDSAMNFQPGPNLGAGWSHTHPFNVNVNFSGNTDGVGDHSHSFSGGTAEVDHTPPYVDVVFCQKN